MAGTRQTRRDASIYQLGNGKFFRETAYWAPPFDPPAWRAQWVEPIKPV